MPLSESRKLQFTPDMEICRLLNGMWQVSGAHGRIDPTAAVAAMFPYMEAGFTTWDLADHYGPAEDFIGEFRRQLSAQHRPEALAGMQAFTKWVPTPTAMTRPVVEDAVNVSLHRMDAERLDLLQFHWWDYRNPAYLDAMSRLQELRDEGKIRHLALTNFDTEHMGRIVDHGVQIVSNQVQYSLIDRRPAVRMAQYCQEQGIHLLSYGALCGGLLSERYLGQPEPGRPMLNTASLSKYKQMVDVWGGWELFQELLQTLNKIAAKHGVSIANVAVRYVLDQPAVGGVIIGARLGASEHIHTNAQVFGFSLDAEDLQEIEAVLARSRDLYQIIGDCGDEYRR